MKYTEKAGRTADDAIEEALRELQCGRDDVDIEILDEGSKGLFGILGTKLARVRVTIKEPQGIAKGEDFLRSLLASMGISADIAIEYREDNVIYNLSGESLGILIGKHGQTLDSLQYITGLVVNKTNKEGTERQRVIVDAEGYRKRREESLKTLAIRLADRVRRDGRSTSLEPMTAAERRIIHTTLQNNSYVNTHSEGEEPNRRIVISPKGGNQTRGRYNNSEQYRASER